MIPHRENELSRITAVLVGLGLVIGALIVQTVRLSSQVNDLKQTVTTVSKESGPVGPQGKIGPRGYSGPIGPRGGDGPTVTKTVTVKIPGPVVNNATVPCYKVNGALVGLGEPSGALGGEPIMMSCKIVLGGRGALSGFFYAQSSDGQRLNLQVVN
jgi:hypothetical protein